MNPQAAALRAAPHPAFIDRMPQKLALAALSCLVLVVLVALFVDRPVATWVHQNLGDARFKIFTFDSGESLVPIGIFTLMTGPAGATGPAALLTLAGLGIAAAHGWRPGPRGRIVIALCVSVLAANEINRELKWAFGRTWPETWLGDNPSWIRNGVFGFFPFHGGRGWNAFPSGHTTAIATPAALLWIAWPKLRLVWAALVAIVITGLLGANYHFVSDVIAGLYLGAAIGVGFAALMLRPGDRIDSFYWPKAVRTTSSIVVPRTNGPSDSRLTTSGVVDR